MIPITMGGTKPFMMVLLYHALQKTQGQSQQLSQYLSCQNPRREARCTSVASLCLLVVIKQKKVVIGDGDVFPDVLLRHECGSGDNIIAAFKHSVCTVAESPASGAEAFWTDASGLRWTSASASSAGMKTTTVLG